MTKEFQAEMQRLDALLRGVQHFPDPGAQSHTRAVVRAVLDLHGAGWERLLDHRAARARPAARFSTLAPATR
jgi:hypothetical protein